MSFGRMNFQQSLQVLLQKKLCNIMPKPILIYDGHCNLCIRLIRWLEPLNQEGQEYRVELVPFQKADSLIAQFALKEEELKATLHFIDEQGQVYQRMAAIEKLSEKFPLLKLASPFWKAGFGDALYNAVAENRYKLFGCSETCYISEHASREP
jgi:predicted DCC family thiol-disulfide oxidoreductase YuxK